MNKMVLSFLTFSLIAIMPLAFADTRYTDINMDKSNGNVNLFWDYSSLDDVEYCTLTTHIVKFYAVDPNQIPLVKKIVNDGSTFWQYNDGKIIKQKYGYVGYLDLGTKTTTPIAMSLLQTPSFEVLVNEGTYAERLLTHEDAKVNCNDSLGINLDVFDYLDLTEFGIDTWNTLRVFNSTGHIIREDKIETEISNWIYPESYKNTCVAINLNSDIENGQMEHLIYSNSTQKAFADYDTCQTDDYTTFIEEEFSITIPITQTESQYFASLEPQNKKNTSSYNTPPTLGLNHEGKRLVEGGFSYNENKVDANYFHTEYPLITTNVGDTNTIELVIYEGEGIHNIKWVQLMLGVETMGNPLSESEVIFQLILSNTEFEELNITDDQNLIQNLNVTSIEPTKCKSSSNTELCLKVIFEYEYREAPLYNIVAVNLMDTHHSSWNYYFNDGVEVLGESINEPPTDSFTIRKSNESEITTFHLYRTDKINDIWTDQFGVEYQKTPYGQYDRITPLPEWECNDKPLDQIMNGGDRNNCHFRALTTIWK